MSTFWKQMGQFACFTCPLFLVLAIKIKVHKSWVCVVNSFVFLPVIIFKSKQLFYNLCWKIIQPVNLLLVYDDQFMHLSLFLRKPSKFYCIISTSASHLYLRFVRHLLIIYINTLYSLFALYWQEALRALWQASFPDTDLSGLVSEQWKDMGWQGPNPSTDFR